MKKKMLSFLLATGLMMGLMMGLMSPALAAETYEVPVKFMNYHETDKESMANKALKPTAVAVVDGETTEIKLALKPMEMSGVKENINKLFVLNGTEKTEAKKETAKGEYDVLVTFKVKGVKPATVDLAFWIDAMDKLQGGTPGAGEQKAKLNLDWAQAKQVTDQKDTKPNNTKPTPKAKNGMNVSIKGQEVAFSAEPIKFKGSVLVPFRETFSALGATVTWDEKTKTAIAKKDNITLTLVMNQKTATKEVDGKKTTIELNAPAQMVKYRTYIPLRFAGEGFGNKVEYKKTATGEVITID